MHLMRRLIATPLFASLLVLMAGADDKPDAGAGKKPAWLWLGTKAAPGQVVFLRHTFDVKLPAEFTARLVATADDAMEIFLNGVPVLKGDGWTKARFADVTAKLKDGSN